MKRRTFLTAASAALAAAPLSRANAQAPKVFNLAFVGRLTAPEGIAMTQFADAVKKGSNGRYEIRLHPGGALGGDRDALEGTQLGTVDIAISSTSIIANFIPDLQIFDIPFLFRDFDHAQGVLDSAIGQEILDKMPARGFQGVAFGGIGFRQLTNSKRPVHTPDDVKGMKIRTQENQIHLQVWRGLGALPTPMALPEVFTSLQNGTVDGQENPIGAIINNKFGQVQKHLTITNHAFTPLGMVMNLGAFKAMSADDQKMLVAEARRAMQTCKAEVAKVEATGVDELRKLGLQVVEKVDTAKFQEILKPTFADLAKRFGEQQIARIRDFK